MEAFVKGYRDATYICNATNLDEFIDEIWFQRRIELWGEGFSLFDVLRLKKPIKRIGTNFPAGSTFADIAAESPLLIYTIPECETAVNKASLEYQVEISELKEYIALFLSQGFTKEETRSTLLDMVNYRHLRNEIIELLEEAE